VPVFGMLAAALAFGEPLPAWKIQACVLLLAGLAVISLWPRIAARFAQPATLSGNGE